MRMVLVSWLLVLPIGVPITSEAAEVLEVLGSAVRAAPGAPAQPISAVPLALGPSDELRTSANGSLSIRLSDDSLVRLGANSSFVVLEESSGFISLLLSRGKAWAAVAKRKRRNLEIRTPTAVAAVRGTRFSVETLDTGRTITEVQEGQVAVTALKDGAAWGQPTLLNPGQRVEIGGGGETTQPTPAPDNKAVSDREIGLQRQQDFVRSTLSQGALSPSVSPISALILNSSLSYPLTPAAQTGLTPLSTGINEATPATSLQQPQPPGTNCTVTCVLGVCVCR